MAALKYSLLAVLLLAAYVSASDVSTNDLTTTDATNTMLSSISSVLVDWVTRIVEYLFELFDLKLRTIRFLISLYTDENLHLLKRYMTIGLRILQWLYNIIPENTSEVSLKFLSYLFPQQNLPEEIGGPSKKQPEKPDKPEHDVAMPSLLHNPGVEDKLSSRESDALPSLLHNLAVEDKPASRESDSIDQVTREGRNAASEINPFADQIISLDNLINAARNRK